MSDANAPLEALHLFANNKITGPAELALETARWLPIAAPRVRATFYSSAPPASDETRDRWLQQLARERGIPEPSWQDVRLPKHFSPLSGLRDMRRLTRHLRAAPPALIHTHSNNDHFIGGLAARRALGASVPIVRTLYDGEPPRARMRLRYAFRKLTDRLICLSSAVAEALLGGDFGLDPERVLVWTPPIDTERFDPSRELPDLRARLDIAADAPVYGIVARMQTHRRFEVLIEAIKQVSAARPEARCIIVGRGTNQQTVARDPVAEQGLSEFVRFAGYVSGDDYVGVLKALDLKVFLVPGSDGTCRAVREALSMGVPVVAARRGMLPEIVRDGHDGRVIDDEPETLAATILELLDDTERRRQMSAQARQRAVEEGSFRAYSARLGGLYEELCATSVG